MKIKPYGLLSLLFCTGIVLLTACNQQAGQPSNGAMPKVVATTTILGDVVSRVGGDLIELNILLPVGADPHGFDPTPQDVAVIADAEVVFANGLGLEVFLDNLIESAGAEDRVVFVSDGLDLLAIDADLDDQHEEDQHQENDHAGSDPHTWTDPNNVLVWVGNIQRKLSEVDPENAPVYAENAQKYAAELKDLDAWIRQQVASIPPENRKLITDHALFNYFAEEYGLNQVGALIPGYSTLAEPTARELAAIEDAISDLGVKAVFVGSTVNPALSERIAEDTGVRLIYVYTGSLSEAGGEAETYLEYMRFNTQAFVEALR
jgi:ABC-type Zn uptake system ZnuABC Zn-binding protein ZnuA